MLGGEVVPVIRGAFANRWCEPSVSDSNYVVSSHHVDEDMATDG